MNKVAVVGGGGARAQWHGLHSLGLTWLLPLLHSQSASIMDQHGVCNMVPFLGDDQLAKWWRVDYTELLPLWKGKYSNITDTLDMNLPPMHTMFLPKLPSVDLGMPYSPSPLFHTTLLLIKELASQRKKCGDGPMLMEFSGLNMFSLPFTPYPPHPEAALWDSALQILYML